MRANMLAQLRLDQCSVIDNYVDSRTDEFLKERQDCVRQAIKESNGNFEEAMSTGKLTISHGKVTVFHGKVAIFHEK